MSAYTGHINRMSVVMKVQCDLYIEHTCWEYSVADTGTPISTQEILWCGPKTLENLSIIIYLQWYVTNVHILICYYYMYIDMLLLYVYWYVTKYVYWYVSTASTLTIYNEWQHIPSKRRELTIIQRAGIVETATKNTQHLDVHAFIGYLIDICRY